MPDQIEILSDEFKSIVGGSPQVEEIASGMAFCEGTCWVPERGILVWSDIPNNRLMQWSEKDGASVFRSPCGNTNGNTVDLQGRILSCETSGRKVSRTEPDGSVVTVVDRYRGRRLTSPNDIVVKSDGSVWFTDPDYGALHPELGHGEKAEQDRNGVYHVVPETGEITRVSGDFDKPNGIAFSPDEKTLYVSDTGRTHGEFRNHHIVAFDVGSDGISLANPRVVAEFDPWVPDGFRVDVDGNLYVSIGDGIHVVNSSGEMLGKIHTPEVAANCAFGMDDRQTLFIAATSSVWRIKLNTAGASRPSAG